MATTLIATFVNSSSDTQQISWANVDPESSMSTIRTFLNAVVTNSAALLKVALVSVKEAKLRTTTDTPVPLT